MKSLLPSLPLLVAAMFVFGCSTVESRIREKPGAFSALPEADQQRIRKGTIAVGDSRDVVYIALGSPDVRRSRHSANGHETVWIYRSYYESYAGSAFAGYRRHVVFDPGSRRYIIYHEPVYASVYSEQSEDRIRVTFADGRVSAIEEEKR